MLKKNEVCIAPGVDCRFPGIDICLECRVFSPGITSVVIKVGSEFLRALGPRQDSADLTPMLSRARLFGGYCLNPKFPNQVRYLRQNFTRARKRYPSAVLCVVSLDIELDNLDFLDLAVI